MTEPAFAEFLRKTEAELSAKGWVRMPEADAVFRREAQTPEPSRIRKALHYLIGTRLHAQDIVVVTGDGEMVWAGYHDGDWNTWEGGVWVRDYLIGDTWNFTHQFDYSGSVDGSRPVFTYWGPIEWRDGEGRTRQGSIAAPSGFLAKLAGALCPSLEAQASDGLGCDATARQTTRAFMRQGWERVRENTWWLLTGAAGAGLSSGSSMFFPYLTLTGAGVLLDGYLGEFRRYYNRCIG